VERLVKRSLSCCAASEMGRARPISTAIDAGVGSSAVELPFSPARVGAHTEPIAHGLGPPPERGLPDRRRYTEGASTGKAAPVTPTVWDGTAGRIAQSFGLALPLLVLIAVLLAQ
jgi:hypothetical protein